MEPAKLELSTEDITIVAVLRAVWMGLNSISSKRHVQLLCVTEFLATIIHSMTQKKDVSYWC